MHTTSIKNTIKFVLLSLFLIISTSVFAVNNFSASNIPSNQVLNSPVVDLAHVLSDGDKNILETKLHQIYDSGKAQVAIIIVPTTDGVPIFDYALQVADKWKLGEKNIDDGILIAVAIEDRELYILTGYGVEGALPDGAVGRIIRQDIMPSFKQNNYMGGLLTAVNRIEERLNTDPEALARADNKADSDMSNMVGNISPDTFFNILPILFVIFFFIRAFVSQYLSSLIFSGISFLVALSMGIAFFKALAIAILVFAFFNYFIGFGGGGGYRYDDDDDYDDFGGGFGGGGFGGGSSGGGFGGGGFSGGGGSFGGGGAGGSW